MFIALNAELESGSVVAMNFNDDEVIMKKQSITIKDVIIEHLKFFLLIFITLEAIAFIFK